MPGICIKKAVILAINQNFYVRHLVNIPITICINCIF